MLGLLYTGLFLVLLARAITIYRSRRINTEFIITIGIMMYYAVPGIRHNIPGFTGMYALRYGISETSTIEGFLLVTIFVLTYYVFYHAKVISLKKTALYIPNEKRAVKRLGRNILIFAMVFFFLYCSLYGGVRAVFQSIDAIRGGEIISSNAKFEFIGKLYNIVIYAPVLVFAYWKKSPNMRLLILISLVFTLLVQISKGGRGSLLLFFLVFIVAKINTVHSSTKRTKQFIVIGIIGFLFIVVYRPFISSTGLIAEYGLVYAVENFMKNLMGGGRYSISTPAVAINSLLDSFDHYYVSMETAVRSVKTGMHHHTFFMELFATILAPVPSLLLGIEKPLTNTVYNSFYIAGREGIAQIPAGIIGSGYYSGGFLWVILYGIIVALAGKVIDNFYKRIKNNVTFSNEYYVIIMIVYFGFALSGDFPDNFKKEFINFPLYYIIWRKMKKVNLSEKSGYDYKQENTYKYEKNCTFTPPGNDLWRSGKKIGQNSK